MRAYCRAKKFPQQVLLTLQFYQQFAGFVGCQGGRSTDNGNADASAAPAVEAGLKTIYGVPQVEELGYRVAIKVCGVAKIEQVAFFVVGWSSNGKPLWRCVNWLIVGGQEAGFGMDGVLHITFYGDRFFATALYAGRVLYFFAVGGCREGVAVVPSNNVVAHFFQFGFVGNIFKGIKNCLYANDTLIGVVERKVKCIWTQILSPLYRFSLAQNLIFVKFRSPFTGRRRRA